jgi:ribosomal protein S18 acetylase RimI-like enzyme
VGVASAHAVPSFAEAEDSFVRITALAVDAHHRRRGVARALTSFAENWAREREALLLEVSSGRRPEREAAHAFYQALGYRDTADHSARYWKPL